MTVRTFAMLLAFATCAFAPRAEAFSSRLLAPDGERGAAALSILATAKGQAPHLGLTYAAGVGTALLAIPVGLVTASFAGNISNNLILSLLPGLLVQGLVAPLLTTSAMWLMGNASGDQYRFWPAFLVSVAVNAAALVVGGFLGVSLSNAVSILLFTLAEAVVLPGSIALMMWLTRYDAPAPSAPSSLLFGNVPQATVRMGAF